MLDEEVALDTACFHAQQAAEKYIKAYLISKETEHPFIHDLEKLIAICATIDPSFSEIVEIADPLTPYAVELRYDFDFHPDYDRAADAVAKAESIRAFVIARLPDGIRP